MQIAERKVNVPMFLSLTYPVRRAMYEFGRENDLMEGDTVHAKIVGTTKDSDGWPMYVFQLTLCRED